MLWHVEDTNLHLMASIHVLERTGHGLFPEAEQIYLKATRIAFEHDMLAPPDSAFTQNVASKPLSAQVPAAIFVEVAREWENLGLNLAVLEQLQPWFVALAIIVVGAAKRGIDVAYGVDKVLWGRSEQDGKTRTTLEKQEDPLTIFRMFPAHETASLLDYVTNPPAACQTQIDIMVKAWHDHDDGAMEQILGHRLRMCPVGFAKLITGRNRAWIPSLLRLAADKVPTLVVVGALHCVGADGIPKLLEESGSRLSRLI